MNVVIDELFWLDFEHEDSLEDKWHRTDIC